MKKKLFIICFLSTLTITAQNPRWGDWWQWGDLGNGQYANPIIPSDYSDLDCIRVGDDYYAISSTMQYSPGMTILHSKDLVNWEIAGNAVADLTQIGPALSWKQMDRYGRGIWAGTLRFHQSESDRQQGLAGRFYLFFGTPNEGVFMSSATAVEGPWTPLVKLIDGGGWDDCSAIWDDEGNAWFIATHFADNYKSYIFPMADDATSIDRSKARLVNEGNGREASKLIKHGDYYYIVFSEHRNGVGRYVMAKRDKTMWGDFKEERQLLQTCTEANEPNQGGIILGKDNHWYFLTHHGSGDWSGRIVSLLPVEWIEGWPMMGDISNEMPGQMVWRASMPANDSKKLSIQRGDNFNDDKLGPQWQWNYQPRDEMWSLSERPGWLRLRAFRPLENDRLLKAGNTITQRSFRNSLNEVTIKIDISHMADGQHAGLCHFAEHSGALGVVRSAGRTYLERRNDDNADLGLMITSDCIWLRSSWGLDGRSIFEYSTDGNKFIRVRGYQLSWGFYRGDRIGIYCYNNLSDSGYIDVDFLHYFM